MDQSMEEESYYTNFAGTYKMISFVMGIGMIYPNPNTERRRVICVLIALLSTTPLSFIIMINMYDCWKIRDIINIIRHTTIFGPFVGGFFKIILQFYKKKAAKGIIDVIDGDYASYNHLETKYKSIIDSSIASNKKYSERCWAVTVIVCVSAFPVMAVVSNVHSHLFSSDPQKFMVHDVIIPFMAPEDRFNSPIFEIMFVYMLYICVLYVVNFIGYDGFFGLSINHACLKMEIYCKAFEDALTENSDEMYAQVVKVIDEQNNLKRFVDLIQDTFNLWLGVILVATMIQIGTCMYLISEGYALDLRYIIFVCGTVIHIYLPCRYAAKLKHMSLETATLIYSAGWENVSSKRLRKMVIFMIAKAQIPFEITAFNLMVFDMDLFVSILNSSYSMYTLLRS